MTHCQPASSTVSPLLKLQAVRRTVERRGGCCTPQHLIDEAHDDPYTIDGGTALAEVHMSAPETAQSPVNCRL